MRTRKDVHLQAVTHMGLLIAMEIILSRFLAIQTPVVKISLAFLPIVLIAIRYGAMYAVMGGAIAEFIGSMLFPIGPYFPGFTLTAALTGAVFAVLLHKKQTTFPRALMASLVVNLILHLVLDSIWLFIMMGNGMFAFLPTRALKSVIMVPIMMVGIKLVSHYMVQLDQRRRSLS